MSGTSPFSSCKRFLSGHGPRKAAKALAIALEQVGDDENSDIYGHGPLIEDFERNVAEDLGAQAAIFMPSGTMAQQIALRVHAEGGNKRVAMHATSHLELHEEDALRVLHGLERELLGDASRLFSIADLEALEAAPPATILWELPQREIGGQLPSWDELSEQLEWARGHGIHCHLDGARLWEAAPFYQKSHAEVAQLFDSVYVSFYKGLGGIAGAVLAGETEFIQATRPWLRRHGGNLISLFPYVLSAKAGLERYAGSFEGYWIRARALAASLGAVPGITVVPAMPQTCMMHLHINCPAQALNTANEALARTSEVMLFGKARPLSPSTSLVEVAIGSASASLSDAEVQALFRSLLAMAV